MKVGTRIYLTFFLFVGLLLALAAFNYLTTGRLAEKVVANVAPSRLATAVLGIDRDLARLSYAVHTGDNPASLYAHINQRLDELETGPIPDPQRGIIKRIRWLIADYWSKHGELQKLAVERDRLAEVLLPELGEKMRLRIAELTARAAESGSTDATRRVGRVAEILMLARLSVFRYASTRYPHDNRDDYREARRMLVELDLAVDGLARQAPNGRMREGVHALAGDVEGCKELFGQLEQATDLYRGLEDQMEHLLAENAQLVRELSGDADRSLVELQQSVRTAYSETRGWSLALALMAAMLAALAAHLTGRRITAPLSAIAATIGRVTRGEHHTKIPEVDSTDEIGDLARAATEIRELVAWSEAQRWIHEGLTELARTLQEAATPEDLATEVTRLLAPKLNRGFAALYLVRPGGRIQLAAGFGLEGGVEPRSGFAQGEGLVGQCAAQLSAIYLDRVPSDYLRIRSGLGERDPAHVALLPIVHRSVLHGVFEIAGFEPLSPPQRSLLEEAMPLLALHFENVTRHQRTRELLEESQRQAEELQASEEELKRQSEEMQAINERLSEQKRALEAAGEAATRTAEELAEASRHKSEFLANMSHELRTPLNSLLILSKDLARNAEGNLTAEQIESAQVIHDAGSHLLGLINDVLDLSKVEAGKITVLREEVDLPALLETVRKRFAPAAEAKGLAFTLRVAEEAPRNGWTDRGRLEQILHNLLSNAVKYTDAGNIHLTLDRYAGDNPEERWARIAVSDTGSGVDPQDFDRIFDAFERLDHHGKATGGTGLGLAIALRLARLLGGDLTLVSRPGEGSTFNLLLPLQRQAAQVVDPAPALPSEKGRGNRVIVVVEEDSGFAALLARRVEEMGFLSVTAPDGAAGIDAARRYRPAGVILDLTLPDMDGWRVIDALKGEPALAEIPVHLLIGSGGALEEEGGGAAIRPVSGEQIGRILSRIAASDAAGSRKVLLGDADPASRAATAAELRERGLEVVESGRADELLTQLAAGHYCCLVSELRLADSGVVEMLERARREIGELPAVILFSEEEPTVEEAHRLREYTDTVVLKGGRSPQRLLDEVSLFLHSVDRSTDCSGNGTSLRDEPAFRGKTVLLVDDDMRNAFAMSKVLRREGLKVLLARNGRKALEMLDEAPQVDLVLMDMMMPEMDGIEATKAIRSLPAWKDLPIIALTAKAMRGDRERCLDAGASDYLSKPVDPCELLSRLRGWLAG